MRKQPSTFMPPEKRTIIAPEGGWKDQTLYVVEVAFSSTNPVHLAMFFSGFLNDDGQPGSYNQLTNPSWEDVYGTDGVHYLKVVEELPAEFQIYRHEDDFYG